MQRRNFHYITAILPMVIILAWAGAAFATKTLSLESTSDGSTQATQFTRGEDVFVNILVNDATDVAGCAFTLEYDPAILVAPETKTGQADPNDDGTPVDTQAITSIFPFSFQSTPTHRENSQMPGMIYFSGATIDPATGGAIKTETDAVLFTVKFSVKNDAPFGGTTLTLRRTELFNLSAGYGIDTNQNGIFDQGVDTKEPVPLLVGAVPVSAGLEVFNDFDCSDGICAFPVLLSQFDVDPTAPIQIVDCTPHSVGGTITYNGRQTGTLNVAAFAPEDTNFQTPLGGNQYSWGSGQMSQSYNLGVCDGTYMIGAFIDTEPNSVLGSHEPQGMYGSQVVISGADDATARDFSLIDPDSDGDGLPDYWENPKGNLDPAADDDNDGYSNLTEFERELNYGTTSETQDEPFGEGYDITSDNRAQYQHVTTVPAAIRIGEGKSFSFAVQYTTTDSNPTLNGLGLRIHYDSSKVTWNLFENVLATNRTTLGTTPQDDTDDKDGDAKTDKFIVVAWADTGSAWPGIVPVKLFDIQFTMASGLADGDTTTIRFSSSSSDPEYTFYGAPVGAIVSPFTLDVDGNGYADALTDGLMLMRYLFDARGQDLIVSAHDPSGSRTTPEEIEAYIEGGLTALNVDGNIAPDALTDILMILRYLFDARGEDLIRNAHDPSGIRNTAEAIEAYIENMIPPPPQ